MKTGFVYARENSQRKFRRVSNGVEYAFSSDGVLRDQLGVPVMGASMDEDWVLVREPIPWQDALEFWVKGITVTRELGGTNCSFTEHTSFMVSRNELINGKWYIE